LSEQFKLKLETSPSELEKISAAVEDIGQRENWPAQFIFRVNLVLEELGLNIMNYGHDEGLHEFEITLTSEADVLRIEVTDDGRPFDPLNEAPEADLDASVDDRQVGGLGIYLVRTMVDEMSYRREQDKNHLTLVARKV
jgi:anti-sigma regulatory factor (Ser/Thr protein kinase)